MFVVVVVVSCCLLCSPFLAQATPVETPVTGPPVALFPTITLPTPVESPVTGPPVALFPTITLPTPVESPVTGPPVALFPTITLPTPVESPVTGPPVALFPTITLPTPVADCTITWKLFNSNTDVFVADLSNGVTIANPPPCGRANIEAVVPCATPLTQVTLDLFQGSRRIKRRTELEFPYFLFGNNGLNIQNGKIPAGRYGIRALVNGVWSPFTNFTLGGSCS